jgi:hypothetical protein
VERVPRKDGAGVLHTEGGGGPAQCASSQFFFFLCSGLLSDGWMVRADCLATPLDPLHWLSDWPGASLAPWPRDVGNPLFRMTEECTLKHL